MALESFFEDLVLDTPEALDNFIAFMEEEPQIKLDGCPDIRDADEDTIRRLVEHLRSKE